MSEIKDNIKRLRLEADMSQETLAGYVGKTRSAISQYESGGIIPKMGVIEDMAALFKVSKSEIIGDSLEAISRYATVPLYGSIAAGQPIEMIETDDVFEIPTPIADRYPNAFLLKVSGESMNKILPNGSYALIDPCDDVDVSGKPYAVCINGYDATIKRVDKLANGFRLVPESTDPTYEETIYNYNEPGTDQITIIGKVVYYVLPYDWTF